MPRSPVQSVWRPRPYSDRLCSTWACGVHRERARSREPAFVSRALEQRQERVAVPRRAVAEACALPQRPGAPRQLAARDRELLVEEVARASQRSPARRGTTACGSGRRGVRRAASSRRYGGQLTSPSSSTAKGRSVSETSAASSPSASAQPANPCAGPRQRRAVAQRGAASTGRPRRVAAAATRCSPRRRARARGPRESCPGLPDISSHRSSCSFAAISSASRSRLACDGASLCNTSRIPVSPIQRLRSASSSGKSGGASSERSRYGT